MNTLTPVYDAFAGLLSYPAAERREFAESLKPSITMFASGLEEFGNAVGHLSLEEMEELYTRTFDINPVANLEVGWHLYGEQYERGAFLVKMREVLRNHRVEESSELPDHLTHVLMALGRMDKEEADVFAATFLLPALDKILAGFKDQSNPYEHLLTVIKSFVEHHHLAGVTTNE